MQNRQQIFELISSYQKQHTNESDRTKDIKVFLDNFDGKELFNRKNFTGHITASTYIINPAKDSILLLKHKVFDRWLQPGGHVDETDDSLIDAALREAEEETGIAKKDFQLFTDTIFDIDSHAIPNNEKKNEPPHVHHDISFLFLCNTNEINFDESESTAGKWVHFSELENDEEFELVITKIKSVI